MRILVGIDGSETSARAVEWCAGYASQTGADVVAVFAVEGLDYDRRIAGILIPPLSDDRMAELQERAEVEWCGALTRAGVPFRVLVLQGPPAKTLMHAADAEHADLVVTGRRGHGGLGPLHLGSTSSHLAHHERRPVVIVP